MQNHTHQYGADTEVTQMDQRTVGQLIKTTYPKSITDPGAPGDTTLYYLTTPFPTRKWCTAEEVRDGFLMLKHWH